MSSPNTHAERWGRTWVEVEPAALRSNFRRAAALLPPGVRIWACLKKDGYGHGLPAVARALEDEPELAGFCVATLEEAIALKEDGASQGNRAVLILAPLAGAALEEAIRIGAELTVTDVHDASAAHQAAMHLGRTAVAHLKIDTGMGRLGQLPADAVEDAAKIAGFPRLKLEAIYSHLADAWNDRESCAAQRRAFDHFRAAAELENLPAHWGGSDALAFARDLPPAGAVRLGISLYGDHPAADFEPAMAFKTRVIYRRRVPAGTPVSYGSTFVAPREMELAVIGAGYGNGMLRSLSGRGEVLIGGRPCPILGRVCMDQTVVDVSEVPGAAVGDDATLFGWQANPDGATALLAAGDVARAAGTISYELFCLAGQLNPRFEAADPRPNPA